jgi:hypothetical protein
MRFARMTVLSCALSIHVLGCSGGDDESPRGGSSSLSPVGAGGSGTGGTASGASGSSTSTVGGGGATGTAGSSTTGGNAGSSPVGTGGASTTTGGGGSSPAEGGSSSAEGGSGSAEGGSSAQGGSTSSAGAGPSEGGSAGAGEGGTTGGTGNTTAGTGGATAGAAGSPSAGGSSGASSGGSTGVAGTVGAGGSAAVCTDATCGLVVQEWGTFTSVQASDGHALEGLHHEDEALPYWVHRRNFNDQFNYFFEELPEEPLQQLETPVLYFWTPKAEKVHVKVDFTEGAVGQWYPEATTFTPAINEMKSLANGSMTWDVDVDPAIDPSTFQAVDPAEIWAPSRNVASTPVRFVNQGYEEKEQFIFYRGLGKFNPSVHVVSDASGSLHVRNESSDALDAVFVFRRTGDTGTVITLGALGAGSERVLSVPQPSLSETDYVAAAKAALHGALVKSGLNDDVAQAMVDTWTRSWFGNEGLRVLYLAPRSWTDAWLPTTVTPAPVSFVRTLVGRIEVILPAEEQDLAAKIHESTKTGIAIDPLSLGRFAEPRVRRANEMLVDVGDATTAADLIASSHALPLPEREFVAKDARGSGAQRQIPAVSPQPR